MSPVAAGGVVAPDYYAIGQSVAGTIAKVCRPLTREQRTALTGALSVWLDAADQRTAAAQAEADRLRVDAERWRDHCTTVCIHATDMTPERWNARADAFIAAKRAGAYEQIDTAIHSAKTEQETKPLTQK